MTTSETQDGPFVAENGLRYASKADRLLGRPEESVRNSFIAEALRSGGSQVARDAAKFWDAEPQDTDWGDVGCSSEA